MTLDLDKQLDGWVEEARIVGSPPRSPNFGRTAVPRRTHRLWLPAGIAATAALIGFAVYLGVADGAKGGVQTLSGQTPTATVPTPVPERTEVVHPVGGAPTNINGQGTKTVDFGTPPATANRIIISFSCLTPGTFTFPGGTALSCTDLQKPERLRTMTFGIPVTTGKQTTTVTASGGARWHLIADFYNVKPAAWGINASGQTYGVEGTIGTPDLVAVIATNGTRGYAYAAELQGTNYTSPAEALAGQKNPKPLSVPVYTSDGKTVIGEFHMG